MKSIWHCAQQVDKLWSMRMSTLVFFTALQSSSLLRVHPSHLRAFFTFFTHASFCFFLLPDNSPGQGIISNRKWLPPGRNKHRPKGGRQRSPTLQRKTKSSLSCAEPVLESPVVWWYLEPRFIIRRHLGEGCQDLSQLPQSQPPESFLSVFRMLLFWTWLTFSTHV